MILLAFFTNSAFFKWLILLLSKIIFITTKNLVDQRNTEINLLLVVCLKNIRHIFCEISVLLCGSPYEFLGRFYINHLKIRNA